MSNDAFKRRFSALLARSKLKAETAVRKAALDLGSQMVLLSPVDTGRFRGTWVYGNAAMPTDVHETVDKTGESSLGRIREGLATWTPGQTIYMVNNLPYSRRLEHGWSQQAPSGMVKLTVKNYSRYLAQALKAAG